MPNNTQEPEIPFRSLPIEPIGAFSSNSNASCGECPALCCGKGVVMELNDNEAAYMTEAGTEMRPFSEPTVLRRGLLRRPIIVRQYILEGDCGNLERTTEGGPGICKAFEDDRRPDICKAFAVGRMGCMTMRYARGVIDEQEYQRYLNNF